MVRRRHAVRHERGVRQRAVVERCIHPVQARAADIRVRTAAAIELVIPVAPTQRVVAAVIPRIIEAVVTAVALQDVVARAAPQVVVAGPALEHVVAHAAVDVQPDAGPRAGVDQVVSVIGVYAHRPQSDRLNRLLTGTLRVYVTVADKPSAERKIVADEAGAIDRDR